MNSPEDVLEHAKFLFALDNKTEIILRNVARNAYYALYHKLSVLELTSIVASERNYGSHELLIRKLRKSDNTEHKELGLKLSSLKEVRVKADYKIRNKFPVNDAYSSLRKVEKVFESMNESNAEEEKNVEESIEIMNQNPINNERPKFRVIK